MSHILGVYDAEGVHFCPPHAPRVDDTVLLNTVWVCDCGRCFRLIGSLSEDPLGASDLLRWWAYDRHLQNRDGGQYLADWIAAHLAEEAAAPFTPDGSASTLEVPNPEGTP
jgi:hypothetical protein